MNDNITNIYNSSSIFSQKNQLSINKKYFIYSKIIKYFKHLI